MVGGAVAALAKCPALSRRLRCGPSRAFSRWASCTQATPLKPHQVTHGFILDAGRAKLSCASAAALHTSCERELEVTRAEILRLRLALERCSAGPRRTPGPRVLAPFFISPALNGQDSSPAAKWKHDAPSDQDTARWRRRFFVSDHFGPHAQTDARKRACTYACVHARVHACMHAYIPACTAITL